MWNNEYMLANIFGHVKIHTHQEMIHGEWYTTTFYQPSA